MSYSSAKLSKFDSCKLCSVGRGVDICRELRAIEDVLVVEMKLDEAKAQERELKYKEMSLLVTISRLGPAFDIVVKYFRSIQSDPRSEHRVLYFIPLVESVIGELMPQL
jgi:hypothetical protein